MDRVAGATSTALLAALAVTGGTLYATSGVSLAPQTFADTLAIAVRAPTMGNLFAPHKLLLLIVVPLALLFQRAVLPTTVTLSFLSLGVGALGVLAAGDFARVARTNPNTSMLFLDVACVATVLLASGACCAIVESRRAIAVNALLLLLQAYLAVCTLARNNVGNEIIVGGVSDSIFYSLVTWSMIFLAVGVGILQFNVLALLWRATGRGRCALLGYGVLFGALVFVDISLVSLGLTLYFILLATWLLVARARIAAVLRQLLRAS